MGWFFSMSRAYNNPADADAECVDQGAMMSIALKGVSKRYGDALAVDGVTLDAPPSAFVALVGPSGCGKSTLLRLIAGLETVDAGEIQLDGAVVSRADAHTPPERRNVGVVFQSYALWPHMTVRENVAFPLEASGVARREARGRIGGLLDMTELADLADREPAALSGGQRQRVALARCLAQGARTILMDEPLANLDPHLRGAMEQELRRFHAESGATILFITHDQREAMALADQVAVMGHGRVLQMDAPETLYRAPRNAEIASFIGRGAVVETTILSAADSRARARLAGAEIEMRCAGAPPAGPAPGGVGPDCCRLSDTAPDAVGGA